MAQENIKRFNVVVEHIMLAGYTAFPHPFYPDPDVLGLSDEQPQTNGLGEELYSQEWNVLANLARETAKWMMEEGYLHAAGTSFRLSSKSLRLLPALVTGADVPVIVTLD